VQKRAAPATAFPPARARPCAGAQALQNLQSRRLGRVGPWIACVVIPSLTPTPRPTPALRRVPACCVCNAVAASVYCRNDSAFLCASCSDAAHAGLPFAHTIMSAAAALKQGLPGAPHAGCDGHNAAAPEHSACGESSPSAPVEAPAATAETAARRVSDDSAQRVPECDPASVPPGLDMELPKGPMDKQALAKTLWGKELDVSALVGWRPAARVSRWLGVGVSPLPGLATPAGRGPPLAAPPAAAGSGLCRQAAAERRPVGKRQPPKHSPAAT
jgi:hypothetical protein